MANPEVRARLKPSDRKRHERLKELYGYKDTHAEDRETIVQAEKDAEALYKLRQRYKELGLV